MITREVHVNFLHNEKKMCNEAKIKLLIVKLLISAYFH